MTKDMYKHVKSLEAVKYIIQGKLKFASVGDLNDPLEMFNFFNKQAVKDSLEQLYENGYTQEQHKWLQCQHEILSVLSPDYKKSIIQRDMGQYLRSREKADELIRKIQIHKNIHFIKEYIDKMINPIRNNVGILSLTDRLDSLPMWAHYSNVAKGFVIKFHSLEKYFNGDSTGTLNKLAPVKYCENPLGMTFDPQTQENLFFTKFSDWQYESEYRIVRALKDCNETESDNEKLFFHEIPPEHITEIIVGWNVSPGDKEVLKNLVNSINSTHLNIREAFINDGKVQLR